MAPGDWKAFDNSDGDMGPTVQSMEWLKGDGEAPKLLLAHRDDLNDACFAMPIGDALGIAAARNKLKDLAELWAWAENLDSAYLPLKVRDKRNEILTRLRGE